MTFDYFFFQISQMFLDNSILILFFIKFKN